MSDHSVKTLLENVKNGCIKNTRARVYATLQNRTLTLNELKERLYMKHQTLTSALSWLADEGLIIMHDGVFYPASEEQRSQLKAMRAVDRYNKWVKIGEKEKWFDLYISKYTDY